MKKSYAHALSLATRENKERARLILTGDLPDEGITTQVIDSRDHNGNVSFLTHDVVPRNFVRVVQNNTNNEQPVFNNKKNFLNLWSKSKNFCLTTLKTYLMGCTKN